MPFLTMILSRMVQAVGVMLVVALAAFLLSNFIGDPISNLVGQEATLEDRERLREDLGLNDPLSVQFLRFVGNALQGDFGISYRLQRPVQDLIAERLPATLELVAVSAVFAVVLGIGFGVFTAIHRENPATQILEGRSAETAVLSRHALLIQAVMIGGPIWLLIDTAFGLTAIPALAVVAIGLVILGLSAAHAHQVLARAGIAMSGLAFVGGIVNALLAQAVMTISLIGVSLPTFVVGILLIFIFAVTLQWLPSFGRGDPVEVFGVETRVLSQAWWASVVLPAITLGLYQLTIILRLVRAEMLEVLRTDYIKFARARGLPDRAVYFGHALKNTLLPVITIVGLQVGGLIAFSIITETVFQWPGMGLLFIQGVQFADVPIMSAYLVLASLIFVIVNFVVDVLYYAIDPRLRAAQSGGRGT